MKFVGLFVLVCFCLVGISARIPEVPEEDMTVVSLTLQIDSNFFELCSII